MKFAFSHRYTPPAPVLEATLSTLSGEKRAKTIALIDTGADATIVPLSILLHLEARPAFSSRLRSQWGEHRQVLLYLVDIQIDESTFPGAYVVGDGLGEEVILGRDLLNRLKITLDGPAATVQIDL